MPAFNTIRRHALLALACLAVTASAVQAQTLAPLADGTLRIVVGYPAGGGSDRVARLVADKLKDRLGVPVVVENKTGAGGRVAAQQVKTTPAGQNVLMLANPAVMVVAPLVFKDIGYDPETDFVPVSLVNSYEMALTVSATMPLRQLSHLLAWLKANPEQATFGVPATGSLPHFFALMVAQEAKVKPQVVGYRGSAPLLNDLLGGQVPIAVDTIDSVEPQHRAGKLRILAVSSAKRLPYAPDVPTFKEAGLNLTATGWNTFFAPKSMAPEKIDQIAKAIAEVMKDPAMQRVFSDAKLTPEVNTRSQTEAAVKAFRAQWGPVVKSSGYTP